jgi:type I restriction enzyme S subunit
MIKGMEIELPSLADQQRIVSKVDMVREETEHLESIYTQKLSALESLKSSLLHQAFVGAL